jgi:cell division transport system ATP-binding protein
LIECLQLSKSYGRECELFRGATLRVRKGEFVVISGASGSGKSTLLRMFLAMECPDAGQVLFQGRNVHEISGSHLSSLRQTMGIVAQKGRLVPEWTLFDNVALPLVVAGKDRWLTRKRVLQTLESLSLHPKANGLSRGLDASENRRAEIARAAVHSPLILLADEPLQNLEPGERAMVMSLFSELSVEGSTFVILSREPAEMLGVPGARWIQIAHRRFEECLRT